MSNYTVEATTCRKDHWGKWTAKTAVVFPGVILDSMKRDGQRVMNITTYKTDRGILQTSASAVLRGDRCESHCFGLGGGGDWSKRIFQEPVKMANEKRILEQHARAVAQIATLAEEVTAYYAKASTEAA